MLVLRHLIGQGHVRACYCHPTNSRLCVKVALNPNDNKLLEKEVHNNALFRKTLGPYVPRYYKAVKTNKGLGVVTDLICDDNNRLSQCLVVWMQSKKTLPTEIVKQFDDFFSRLLKYRLWFYDFNNRNFVICRTRGGHYRLFFVDTKSLNRNNSWSTLKLEYVCPFLARIRVLRRIRRFYAQHKLKLPAELS